MNLIKCPVCGKQVSSSAPQCPNCGQPIVGSKTEATTGISALIVVGGVVATCVIMLPLVVSIGNTGVAVALSLLPTIGAFVFASTRKK